MKNQYLYALINWFENTVQFHNWVFTLDRMLLHELEKEKLNQLTCIYV